MIPLKPLDKGKLMKEVEGHPGHFKFDATMLENIEYFDWDQLCNMEEVLRIKKEEE